MQPTRILPAIAWLLILGGCEAAEDAPSGGVGPERVSSPGEYAGYSERIYNEHVLESVYVEVRDGTRLAVDIFRPAVDGQPAEGRFPVIWEHTPYRRAHLNDAGERVSSLGREGRDFLALVQYGYVVAAVDTRGRGASFGVRRGFLDRTEANDAYDMTEWFAAQPWSDGNIGMAGCSYTGSSTLHAATTAPPSLKAIAPGCFAFDSYRFVSRGGIAAQFNTRPEVPETDYGYGVAPVDEDTDGSMAAEAIRMHYDSTPMMELWKGMPYRDDVSGLLGTDFWRETSPHTYREAIEASGVGIFMWGNWRDEGSFQQTLAFNNLSNPTRLWMGGWGHCEVGDFPMMVELHRFFDFYLKGVDNGWEDEPAVHYYTIGAEEESQWRSSESWPPSESQHQTLYLNGAAGIDESGRLSAGRGGVQAQLGRFRVDYEPVCDDPADTYFLFWPCVIEQHGVTYTSPPLAEDLHLLGHPVAELMLSASTPDADVFVYLEALDPEGRATVMTMGRLRASHRTEQAPELDYMGLPYHRGNREDAVPLVPGEPARLRLDLLPTSRILGAGHRLRLRIAGADPRQRYRTVSFDPPPEIRLHSLRDSPSIIQLPVVSPAVFGDRY